MKPLNEVLPGRTIRKVRNVWNERTKSSETVITFEDLSTLSFGLDYSSCYYESDSPTLSKDFSPSPPQGEFLDDAISCVREMFKASKYKSVEGVITTDGFVFPMRLFKKTFERQMREYVNQELERRA